MNENKEIQLFALTLLYKKEWLGNTVGWFESLGRLGIFAYAVATVGIALELVNMKRVNSIATKFQVSCDLERST